MARPTRGVGSPAVAMRQVVAACSVPGGAPGFELTLLRLASVLLLLLSGCRCAPLDEPMYLSSTNSESVRHSFRATCSGTFSLSVRFSYPPGWPEAKPHLRLRWAFLTDGKLVAGGETVEGSVAQLFGRDHYYERLANVEVDRGSLYTLEYEVISYSVVAERASPRIGLYRWSLTTGF